MRNQSEEEYRREDGDAVETERNEKDIEEV